MGGLIMEHRMINAETGEIYTGEKRKITDLMPPYASETVPARDLLERVFFIVNIELVSTRYGDRYVYTLQSEDKAYSLFLSQTSWRDRLFEVWKQAPDTPIGPLTLEKQGRTYVFVDVEVEVAE